jgi:hypothetical protein
LLADDPPRGRSRRDANRNLTAACQRAADQQSGHVEAREEQQAHCRAEQKQHWLPGGRIDACVGQ